MWRGRRGPTPGRGAGRAPGVLWAPGTPRNHRCVAGGGHAPKGQKIPLVSPPPTSPTPSLPSPGKGAEPGVIKSYRREERGGGGGGGAGGGGGGERRGEGAGGAHGAGESGGLCAPPALGWGGCTGRCRPRWLGSFDPHLVSGATSGPGVVRSGVAPGQGCLVTSDRWASGSLHNPHSTQNLLRCRKSNPNAIVMLPPQILTILGWEEMRTH